MTGRRLLRNGPLGLVAVVALATGCQSGALDTFCLASIDGHQSAAAGDVLRVRAHRSGCRSTSGVTVHGGSCTVEVDGDVIQLSGSIHYSEHPTHASDHDCGGLSNRFDCASDLPLEARSYTVEILQEGEVVETAAIEVTDEPRYNGCCMIGEVLGETWLAAEGCY